jgi:hypothetical protein
MEAAGLHGEIDAPEDLPAVDGDMEILDQERGRGGRLGHGRILITLRL